MTLTQFHHAPHAQAGGDGAHAEERPIGDVLPRELLAEVSSWLAPVEMAMLSPASKQWVEIVKEAARLWMCRHGLNPIRRHCCVNSDCFYDPSEPFYPDDDQHYESFGERSTDPPGRPRLFK